MIFPIFKVRNIFPLTLFNYLLNEFPGVLSNLISFQFFWIWCDFSVWPCHSLEHQMLLLSKLQSFDFTNKDLGIRYWGEKLVQEAEKALADLPPLLTCQKELSSMLSQRKLLKLKIPSIPVCLSIHPSDSLLLSITFFCQLVAYSIS